MAENTAPALTLRRRLLLSTSMVLFTGCSQQDDPVAATPPVQPQARRPRAVDDPDIQVEAMLLPGLVNSATDGSLINLVTAMGQYYPGGRFIINAYPVSRVYENMSQGMVDIALPTLRLRPDGDAKLAYRYSTDSFGRVNFVLYSNRKKPITRSDIDKLQQSGASALVIEAPQFDWGFPIQPFTTFESALRKVAAGRLDAFLWAQEEADVVLKQLRLTNVVRHSYGDFEDVLMVPRGPRGNFVDGVVSHALKILRQSGQLEAMYRRIHLPHNPWQPSA